MLTKYPSLLGTQKLKFKFQHGSFSAAPDIFHFINGISKVKWKIKKAR